MAVNQAPISRITAPATATVGTPVVFDPTASTDLESGKNLKVSYKFGDEIVKEPLVPVTHIFATAGTYVVEQTVYDRAGKSGKVLHTIVVSDEGSAVVIELQPLALQNMTVGAPVSQRVTASGGTAPYRFSVVAGALPFGVQLANDGGLFGAPLVAGTYVVTIRATDTTGATGEYEYNGYVALPDVTLPPGLLDLHTQLEFEGYFTFDYDLGHSTLFAYGGGAIRRVGSELRLIFSGSEAELRSPIAEVQVPDVLSPDYWAAPEAPRRGWWPSPYGGKRGTLLPDGTWREYEMNIAQNCGAWWDEAQQVVWWTYADGYDTGFTQTHALLAIRLHADGTTTAYGPFWQQMTDADGQTWHGARRAGLISQAPDGTMFGSGVIGSGNSAGCFGPGACGGWRLPALTHPIDQPIVMPKVLRNYYFPGTDIDPITGVLQPGKTLRTLKRYVEPALFCPYPGDAAQGIAPDQMLHVNKTHYGYGSWTDMDAISSAPIYITHNGRHAYLHSGSAAKDHLWYMNVHKPVDPAHGVSGPIHPIHGTPIINTGPVSTRHFPFFLAMDPADDVRVLAGEKQDHEPEPYQWLNLEAKFGIKTAHEAITGGLRNLAICGYDAPTRRLVCLAHRADDSQYGYFKSLGLVFRLTA